MRFISELGWSLSNCDVRFLSVHPSISEMMSRDRGRRKGPHPDSCATTDAGLLDRLFKGAAGLRAAPVASSDPCRTNARQPCHRELQDRDPGRSNLLPVGEKFIKLPDCTPDIVNRLTTRSPASNTSSIVSKGPFLPGIERFAQAALYRATTPALSNGSGEYPYNSTLASYMLRYPSRSAALRRGGLR